MGVAVAEWLCSVVFALSVSGMSVNAINRIYAKWRYHRDAGFDDCAVRGSDSGKLDPVTSEQSN